MNKLLIYLSIFTLTFQLWSCEEVLDVQPEGTISGDILTDQENIEKLLIGAYSGLGGNSGLAGEGGELWGGDFIIIPTLMAHRSGVEVFYETTIIPSYNAFLRREITASNLKVEANWRRAYDVINMLNGVLGNLNNISDATERDRIEGEARAMRGVIYFEMARLWGPQFDSLALSQPGIPIVTRGNINIDDIQDPFKSSLNAVYTRAETDLTVASELLVDADVAPTRLNYYACQAYLARLTLQKKQYNRVLEHTNNVLNGPYSLNPTPFSAFNNAQSTTEDIFVIQQTILNNAGDRSTGTGLPSIYSSLNESGLAAMSILSTYISNFFAPNDLRGTIDTDVSSATTSDDITTMYYQNIENGNPFILSSAKYMRADRVIPVIRLAEMYLARCEAIHNESPAIEPLALDDLNAVRSRAGLDSLVRADFTSKQQFLDSLQLERQRELLFEGQLLHDLKRWEFPLGSEDPLDDTFILPIPESETNVSGIN